MKGLALNEHKEVLLNWITSYLSRVCTQGSVIPVVMFWVFLQDSITSLHLYLIFRDDAKNEVPSCLLLGKAHCQKIWQACPSKGIVVLLLWVLWWLVFFPHRL